MYIKFKNINIWRHLENTIKYKKLFLFYLINRVQIWLRTKVICLSEKSYSNY